MKSLSSAALLVAAALLAISAHAETSPEPSVSGFTASDTPNDGGQSISLHWNSDAQTMVLITRSGAEDGQYEAIAEVPALSGTYRDMGVEEGTRYYYRLSYQSGADTVYTSVAGPVVARSNWFRKDRLNALVLMAMTFLLVVTFIEIAKKGKQLYIRKIPAVNAMREAIGRATEMGRKILYVPGILSISEIQTIASLAILGHVAKQAAIYGASIEVPNTDPLTFSAARETVKQSFLEAGKPDQFKEDMVTYITYDQFAYAASVTGKMVRERPAANFLIGSFFAESLIFAEIGHSTGAIQIAGTAELAQLPFFVTACDYTLLAEELYAASAYLSKEPVLLGSIKAQDMIKASLMVIIGVGIVSLAFGSEVIRNLLLAQ